MLNAMLIIKKINFLNSFIPNNTILVHYSYMQKHNMSLPLIDLIAQNQQKNGYYFILASFGSYIQNSRG